MKIVLFILSIVFNLIVSIPIDFWKTDLKDKCHCYEILFGKYPHKIQKVITSNLIINEKDECLPISQDIDILGLEGMKDAFEELNESDTKLLTNHLSEIRFIFISILRLTYYDNNGYFEHNDLINILREYEEISVSALTNRFESYGYYLNILHNPTHIMCDNPNMQIKLFQLHSPYIWMLYNMIKSLDIYIKNNFYIKFEEPPFTVKNNFDNCSELESISEIENCYIFVLFNKNSTDYATNNFNDSVFSDIKKYQKYLIDYRELGFPFKSRFSTSYFNYSNTNTTLDQSKYSSLLSYLNLRYSAYSKNIYNQEINKFQESFYISLLPIAYKCSDSYLENQVIYNMSKFLVYLNSYVSNIDIKNRILKETEILMRENSCNNTDVVLENATNKL